MLTHTPKNATPQSRDMLQEFRGYNHNIRIQDNEFYYEENMSSADYPVLSPRRPRGIPQALKNIDVQLLGSIYKDAFYYLYAENSHLKLQKQVSGASAVDLGAISNTTTPRQMVSMGAYIVIFPDKAMVNTQDNMQVTHLEETFTQSGIKFKACNLDGQTYSYIPSTSAPSTPGNKTYWLDTSEQPYVMKQWSESSSMWFQVSTIYLRLEATGIHTHFKEGDGVKITGINNSALSDVNNKTSIIKKVGTDYIVITGVLQGGSTSTADKVSGILKATTNLIYSLIFQKPYESVQPTTTNITVSSSVTIKREVPDIQYVIENDNRLWGCHYGTVDGKMVNEICCCKLGDPTNWNSFAGTSQDSYYVSVGSDGEFTGSAVYGGTILFFKENCIHKIYGNYPANYQSIKTECRGVQKGCSESVKIVNETLFYKSNIDICAYDGSLPVSVSYALGDEKYSDAHAGVDNGKYYISMRDSGGNYHLFCYDSRYQIWHREDSTQAQFFTNDNIGLLFYDIKQSKIYHASYIDDDDKEAAVVEWCAETGVIGFDSPDNKYLSRFNFRMQLEPGAVCNMFIEYDSSGIWESKGAMKGGSLRTFTLPVIPRRCDHLRIKLTGTGDCKIFSIAKITKQGSDRR